MLIGSIDQGTSSTRFTVYTVSGETLVSHQIQLSRSTPHPGWVEQDPLEIINSVRTCMVSVASKLEAINRSATNVCAIGVTNQRETVVVWERETGRPLYNAIVWCDNRNACLVNDLILEHGGVNSFLETTGLPLSPYFTATKLLWLRLNVPTIQTAFNEGTCLVGTIDTWVTWCLTGGHSFVTDVTNASRTFLLNLRTLSWDDSLLAIFGIPKKCLARIKSSAEIYGRLTDEENAKSGKFPKFSFKTL
jgi:glycerol kinase